MVVVKQRVTENVWGSAAVATDIVQNLVKTHVAIVQMVVPQNVGPCALAIVLIGVKTPVQVAVLATALEGVLLIVLEIAKTDVDLHAKEDALGDALGDVLVVAQDVLGDVGIHANMVVAIVPRR